MVNKVVDKKMFPLMEALQQFAKHLENANIANVDTTESGMIRRQLKVGGVTRWFYGETEQELADKYAAAVNKESNSCPTFGEYVRENWESISDNWGLTLKRKSLGQFNKHILPYFGNMRLNRITCKDLKVFINSLAPRYSKNTAKNIVSLASSVFNDAILSNIIDENPIHKARYKYPSKETRRESVPINEFGRICKQIATLDKPQDILQLALVVFTGMRRGEIGALKWEDVDFTNKTIYVHRAVRYPTNQPVIGPPKTPAGVRKIPIIPQLHEILLLFREEAGFILHKEGDSGQPFTESMWLESWKRIKKQVNIGHSTMHCFRHTYATLLAASKDVSLKTIQSIIGHSDIKTTMNRYAHSTENSIQKAGELFGKSVTELLEN